jgi:uncharacterized protein with ParB-like and HNH nuclease domain
MPMYASASLSTVTELQFLPAILRRIENGEIRVPAFQRRFVWSDRQVKDLLRSIYNGYPIGSILLWETNDRSLGAKLDNSIPFPSSRVHYPTTYVLDGAQRLYTLYGVLIDREDREREFRFSVIFDLRKETFKNTRSTNLRPHFIRLSVLFSPKLYIAAQQSLLEQKDGDLLVERSLHLYNVFQQYLIPVVTIRNRSLFEVIEIFEKLNTTGKRLTGSDLAQALSWKTKITSD